jgi:hypothetical protein
MTVVYYHRVSILRRARIEWAMDWYLLSILESCAVVGGLLDVRGRPGHLGRWTGISAEILLAPLVVCLICAYVLLV